MSAMETLVQHIQQATKPYRKGDVVKVDGGVVSIDAFPARPDTAMVVDCHFITVGFTEAAAIPHVEFYRMVRDACADRGQFADLSLDDLRTGPSYITLGGWLGDQTLALDFMALGALHGLWDVVTPARLHISEPEASRMAGMGFVMISGLREPAEATS